MCVCVCVCVVCVCECVCVCVWRGEVGVRTKESGETLRHESVMTKIVNNGTLAPLCKFFIKIHFARFLHNR